MPLASPRFVGCAAGGGGGAPAVSIGVGNVRTNVTPIGAINGINVIFTTPDPFVHDGISDETVYLRGKRLKHGDDYLATESGGPGSGYDTLTLAVAPRAPDNLLIDYREAVPSVRTAVTPIGPIDGVNTVFTTPDLFVHDGIRDEAVYLRGKRLKHGEDYTASESGGAGTGYDTITLVQVPRTPDNLLIDYYLA